MNILKRLFGAKNATLKEPEWWRQTLNLNPVASGAVVTTDTAMTVSAVWACVRIISETIASLPVNVYERTSDGKELASDHPLQFLMSVMPNGEQTSFELLEFLLGNVLLRGTGYGEIKRSGRGTVGEIQPLYTKYMQVARDANGRLVFDYQETGNSRTYSGRQIWRIAGLGSDGVTGYSPISLGRESIGVALSAEEQAAKLYSNGLQVPSVFEKEGVLSDSAFDRLKESLNSEYAGSANAYKTLILEDGLKMKQIGLTAEDSQFLESRKHQIAEIARWYRVPLHMLNELERATFSNIEHQSIEFVMHTIRPWVKRIEATMLRDLFREDERRKYYAEFKIDGLLRGDTQTRYEAYGKGITDGWLNRNEVRGFENLDPVDGLDEYLVPLNMGGADEEAQNAVDSEIKAVSVEHERMDTEKFSAWVGDFYPRHADKLVNAGFDPATVSAYCASHAAALRAPLVNVGNLLSRWKTSAAQELQNG